MKNDKTNSERMYNDGIAETKRLYTLTEASKFDACPVSSVTLKKYCLQGKIGAKVGRQWVLTQKDLLWIFDRTTKDRKAGRPRKNKS